MYFRHIRHIGQVDEREELRHRIVQLLCADSEMTHSVLMDKLEVEEEESMFVEKVLKEVAEMKQSTKKKNGKIYVLKPGL